MAITDKFRIDELFKRGNAAIRKDASDKIVVRKLDGNEIKPDVVKEVEPYGTKPIQGPKVTDVLKSDLNTPSEYKQNPEQQSFSGETFVTLERPNYDSKELQKAVDVKVDELIKEKKPPKERYIKYDKYEKKLEELSDLRNQLQQAIAERDELQSLIEGLRADILLLNSDILRANEQLIESEAKFDELLKKHDQLLQDFQTAIIKGTKEGIERVSLTAQVRGLQAQKEVLQKNLQFQEQLVRTLQDTIEVNKQLAAQQIEAANQQVRAAQATASAAANSKKKKIICNELYHQGYLSKEIWIADENFGDWLWENHRTTAIGYTIWARKVVNFMQRKPQYTKYIYKFLKPWTQQMAYQMGVVDKTHPFGWLTMKIGWQFSNLVYTMYGNEFEKLLSRVNKIG